MLNDTRAETTRVPITDDGRVPRRVRVSKGVLEEDALSPSGVIIRGEIDKSTLRFIRVDKSYQRKQDARPDVYRAIVNGASIPPIDLNVRGVDVDIDGDGFVIHDPVYVIDGGGRVQEALNVLDNDPNANVRLHAVIHFGGDEDWERHRFSELNRNVVKVSANLHLKNFRDQAPAVAALYGLSNNDKSFALYGKVSWGQRMKRGDLISASLLLRVAVWLHGHVPVGKKISGYRQRGGGNSLSGIANRAQNVADHVKLQTFRANVSAYFDLLDKCWGVRSVEYGTAAPQLKSAFNRAMTKLLSAHEEFWSGDELSVPAQLRRKLASFPLTDPHIAMLAGSNEAGSTVVLEMMIRHINSGKRHRRLVSRYAD